MMRKGLAIIAAGLLLIAATAVKPAIAYFTDTTTVEGKLLINLGDGELEELEEDVDGFVKKITITNTGDEPVLVRAKAIYPSGVTLKMVDSTDWSEGTDYYNYSLVLQPGESTTQLNLKVAFDDPKDFNVIIIQEAARVIYDEAGKPSGDWDNKVSTEIGGN